MRSSLSLRVLRNLSFPSSSVSSLYSTPMIPLANLPSSSSLSSLTWSLQRKRYGGQRSIATEQSRNTNDPLIPTSEKVDYYKILGISRTANAEDIKQAFREQGR